MVEDGIFEPDKKNQKTFQGLFQICKSLGHRRLAKVFFYRFWTSSEMIQLKF